MQWQQDIDQFIELAQKFEVRMILIGGGAVNFHGYQRSSVDVDFWIDTQEENLNKLIKVFQAMGYDIESFPDKVKNQMQNISVKFSYDIELELITKFEIEKTFDEAYKEAKIAEKKGKKILYWRVLSYEDLITSKIKSGRPKDLLDIQQLEKIRKQNKLK